MDLPDDKCQMKIEIQKENRRAKKDCMEEMSDKKKTNIGTKIKLDGKLYKVDRWCYFTQTVVRNTK